MNVAIYDTKTFSKSNMSICPLKNWIWKLCLKTWNDNPIRKEKDYASAFRYVLNKFLTYIKKLENKFWNIFIWPTPSRKYILIWSYHYVSTCYNIEYWKNLLHWKYKLLVGTEVSFRSLNYIS